MKSLEDSCNECLGCFEPYIHSVVDSYIEELKTGNLQNLQQTYNGAKSFLELMSKRLPSPALHYYNQKLYDIYFERANQFQLAYSDA